MFRNTLEKMIDVRDLKRAEREDGEAGFTLIELLVVVVIIGILIAIAIPLYLNYTKGAKDKGAESDVKAAVTAIQQCYSDNNNTFPGGATSADTVGYLTLSCGDGGTEKSPVSAGSTVVYSGATAGNYTVTGVSTDGGQTYTYTSSTGQITHAPTTK